MTTPWPSAQDASVDVHVAGPGTLALRYLLIDPASDKVVTSGDAVAGADGGFSVTLPADVTSGLFPGPYKLDLAASSDAIALVAERQADLEVTP